MGIEFLPMKAVIGVLLIFSALVGAIYWRSGGKFIGAFLGLCIGCVIVTAVSLVMPVKLTTNTASYNAYQNQQILSRHGNIPPRVVIETKTFDQLQLEEAKRSDLANKKLKEEIDEN